MEIPVHKSMAQPSLPAQKAVDRPSKLVLADPDLLKNATRYRVGCGTMKGMPACITTGNLLRGHAVRDVGVAYCLTVFTAPFL